MERSYVLLHSPDAHGSLDWVRQKPGVRISNYNMGHGQLNCWAKHLPLELVLKILW